MSYTKQTWKTGDIVTSAKLNHMEDGIENAQFPTVTNSDVGKVLTVEEKSVQGAVLVPEETFVFTDGIMTEINMQNKSLFVEGAECLLTVDSTTITATVQAVSEPESGLIVQDNEIGITILLEESTNIAKLYVPNVGTYTVSLYIEGTEYVWSPVEPSGGGGNIILYLNDEFQLCSLQNGVLSPVSYNTLASFISSGLYPVLCFSSEYNPVDMNLGYLFLVHSILNSGTEKYEALFGASSGGTGIILVNANADSPLFFED